MKLTKKWLHQARPSSSPFAGRLFLTKLPRLLCFLLNFGAFSSLHSLCHDSVWGQGDLGAFVLLCGGCSFFEAEINPTWLEANSVKFGQEMASSKCFQRISQKSYKNLLFGNRFKCEFPVFDVWNEVVVICRIYI